MKPTTHPAYKAQLATVEQMRREKRNLRDRTRRARIKELAKRVKELEDDRMAGFMHIRYEDGRETTLTSWGIDSDESRVCLYANDGTWVEIAPETLMEIVGTIFTKRFNQ